MWCSVPGELQGSYNMGFPSAGWRAELAQHLPFSAGRLWPRMGEDLPKSHRSVSPRKEGDTLGLGGSPQTSLHILNLRTAQPGSSAYSISGPLSSPDLDTAGGFLTFLFLNPSKIKANKKTSPNMQHFQDQKR